VGLRGFMAFEPHPPHLGFLTAAGLRDTWHIRPYLDLLLSPIEDMARHMSLSTLACVGSAAWLVEELWTRGYKTDAWMVTLERSITELPPVPPATLLLRPATATDLLSIERLDSLTFDEIWHRAIGNLADALGQDNSFVLAEMEGRIVGYEWCELYGNQAHLSRLAVCPDYQGRGVGAQLLHRAITDALAHGVKQISLNTQVYNDRSLALYRRFGFMVTDRRMPLLRKDLG
jgi:ribosomal-protein-alanine N-acetyltransferase